jgi:hypothetical protein
MVMPYCPFTMGALRLMQGPRFCRIGIMAFRFAAVLLAFSLVMPLLPAAAARAETEIGDGGDSHRDGSGEHHDSGDGHSWGDGHNDDGNSAVQPTTATTVLSPRGSVDTDASRQHYSAIVTSPALDTEQTKAAIAGGKAASMPLLLTYLNQNYPGQVLDVKLHYATDSYVYEVRYLANVIVLRTLFLDATTLKAK